MFYSAWQRKRIKRVGSRSRTENGRRWGVTDERARMLN